jgi:hypothetical protein
MGHIIELKRPAAYAALLLALLLSAPCAAPAGAAAQPDSRWRLPTGHWAYMYCDYLIERDVYTSDIFYVNGRYVPNCMSAEHFNGDTPVLLSDFAEAVSWLALEINRQQAELDANVTTGAPNASQLAASQVPPLRSIACDLAYEIYGLANARRLLNDETTPDSAAMQQQLAQLQEVWTQFGNPAKPITQAVPGDSHPEMWCFDQAMADSKQWAGLEIIGLIHYAMNASMAPDASVTDAGQTDVDTLWPTHWVTSSLQELLAYTHSGTAERLYGAKLSREKATALFGAALAALRQMPALDSHIVLTAWDLAAELKRQPDAPDALLASNAVIADFGGLAAHAAVPINAGVPLSAYEDVAISHWAYKALDELTLTPWLEGYPDDFFRSGRVLTTYEHAQAVSRLIDTQDSPAGVCHDRHLWLLTTELHAANLYGLQVIQQMIEGLSRQFHY